MRRSNTLIGLCALIAVLAVIASANGLLTRGGGGVYTVRSLCGQTVQIYGRGLYHYDTFLVGAGNRGTDAAILFVEIPLLIVAALLTRRSSLRGGLLLTGSLGCFLYYYASMALLTAYNALFLLYVALFSPAFMPSSWPSLHSTWRHCPRASHRASRGAGLSSICSRRARAVRLAWPGPAARAAGGQGSSGSGDLYDAGDLRPGSRGDRAGRVYRGCAAGARLAARLSAGRYADHSESRHRLALDRPRPGATVGQSAGPIGPVLGFMVSFVISPIVAICLTVVLFRHLQDSIGGKPA